MNHLTVAVDGSRESEAAVRWACRLARNGAALSFCNAVNGTPVNADGSDACEAAVDHAQGLGIKAGRHEPRGRSAEAIVACARENGSEAIVIGVPVRKGHPRALSGVPEALMHVADRPVIVVHEDDAAREGPVAVPVSGRDPLDIVLDPAIAFAAALGQGLLLMTDIVIPTSADYADRTHPAATQLSAAADRARAAGIETSIAMGDGVGEIANTLIALADKKGCSMIVTGLHEHSGIARLFNGSVSEDIVRDADMPVAVVHHAHQHAR